MVSMIVLKIGMAYGKAVQWHLLSLTFTLMHWYLCSVSSGRVLVLYKYGRKLVGDRTAKSRLSKVCINKSQFADDLALLLIVLCLSQLKGSLFR